MARTSHLISVELDNIEAAEILEKARGCDPLTPAQSESLAFAIEQALEKDDG